MMNILFIVIIIITLQILLLMIDNGIFKNKICSARDILKEKGVFFLVKKIFNKLKTFITKIINRNAIRKYLNIRKDAINIGFFIEGGFGDILIFANWLEYFRNKFNRNVNIILYCSSKSIKSIFNYNILNLTVVDTNLYGYRIKQHEVFFYFCIFPKLLYVSKYLHERDPVLHEYVKMTKKFLTDNEYLFEKHPILHPIFTLKTLAKGRVRINAADISSYFNIGEEFIFKLQTNIDTIEYLSSLDLAPQKYITIHRGWDTSIDGNFHVKAWSLKSCGDLIARLKEVYPELKIVSVGTNEEQFPIAAQADINLVRKTDFDQIKVLLANSVLHIDNEGGLVHLRHALKGGPSVVLFGPTSSKMFGYSENINITSGMCDAWCEWVTPNWQFQCIKGERDAVCMNGITTTLVLNKIQNYLEGNYEEVAK